MEVEIEGKNVKVGDWVCFKSDIEQTGKVESIEIYRYSGQTVLVLSNDDGRRYRLLFRYHPANPRAARLSRIMVL